MVDSVDLMDGRWGSGGKASLSGEMGIAAVGSIIVFDSLY